MMPVVYHALWCYLGATTPGALQCNFTNFGPSFVSREACESYINETKKDRAFNPKTTTMTCLTGQEWDNKQAAAEETASRKYAIGPNSRSGNFYVRTCVPMGNNTSRCFFSYHFEYIEACHQIRDMLRQSVHNGMTFDCVEWRPDIQPAE